MSNLVFLGGTCGSNEWRDKFIKNLTSRGVDEDSLFDPIVEDWDEEAQAAEDIAKEDSSYMLYYLGDPNNGEGHTSFYSLLEATMGLYDQVDKTIVVFDTEGMPEHAVKSMNKSLKDLSERFPDALIFDSLDYAEDFLVEKVATASQFFEK